MIIQLEGYFYTGANDDVGVDAHTPLSVVYGESTVIQLAVYTAGRIRYDLSGKSLTLTVKRKSYDTNPRAVVQGVLVSTEGVHRANFTLSSTVTKLIPQRYVYDIWVASGSNRNPVVRLSTFHVEPASRS